MNTMVLPASPATFRLWLLVSCRQVQPASETGVFSAAGAEMPCSTPYSSLCTEKSNAAYGEMNTSSSILLIVELCSSLVPY